MADDPHAMLESVLTALIRAEGRPDVLFRSLSQQWPDARTTVLIGTLLTAERTLTGTFRESTRFGREGHLALAAALAIAEAANDIECRIAAPYIRLSDLIAA